MIYVVGLTNIIVPKELVRRPNGFRTFGDAVVNIKNAVENGTSFLVFVVFELCACSFSGRVVLNALTVVYLQE